MYFYLKACIINRMTSRYITRPLAKQLSNTSRKVVILEGARAVGKTLMMKTELSGFNYVSLADNGTYQYAKDHLGEWLNSLSRPIIIDEAQRLSDLPLAVKELSDTLAGNNPQIILTGSASITRTGLSGQDPLARRSRRFTLFPLTRREINGIPESIVDALWSATPNPGYRSSLDSGALHHLMTIGGFPTYSLDNAMSDRERRYIIRDDINSVLGDTILPEERFNIAIAKDILKSLLCIPGGALNINTIATKTGRDKRTVSRYLGIFINRFLISSLPNIALTADRQNLTHAKIHPIDTSLSVEMLRESGKDPWNEPALTGGVFESFVVNQIVPEIEWSSTKPDAFYWRTKDKDPKEVDLVLKRDEELIGIEMKSSEKLHQGDFQGLQALKDSMGDKFKRGFVVYAGSEVIRHSRDMWAIPVSALWESEGFQNDSYAIRQKELNVDGSANILNSNPSSEAFDGKLFLSYAHEDNDYLNDGIVQFAKAVVRAYRFQTGRSLSLFIDRRDIQWGDNWRKTISQGLGAANFLLPAITPNYLGSAMCREELLQFNTSKSSNKGNRILSLQWVPIEGATNLSEADPTNRLIKELISSHQWLDVSELQFLDPTSIEFKRKAMEVASRLKEAIDSIAAQHAPDFSTTGGMEAVDENTAQLEQFDFIGGLQNIESASAYISTLSNNMTSSMQNISTAISSHPVPEQATAKQLRQWSQSLQEDIQPDVDVLNTAVDELGNQWNDAYRFLEQYTALMLQWPNDDARTKYMGALIPQLQSILLAFTLSDDVHQANNMIQTVGNVIPPLKPLAIAFGNTITLMTNMRSMTQQLINRVS